MEKLQLQALKYSFYLIFHPFDGFYDLKHEKKGNLISANIILMIIILVFILSKQLTGFIFNNNSFRSLNIISEVISVILPLLLWCISNWSITTLMDGEGSLKDIYITTCYALVPIIISNFPLILISNFLTMDEADFYVFFYTLSFIWSVFLIFIGIMTVHQFTVKKTIVTIIIAIIGVIVMLFLGLLFIALIQQIINFCTFLYKELA